MTQPTGAAAKRPLSPHLSVYRWPITMAMSIAHRITGVGLYFGMAILAWWLVATATDADAFEVVASFFSTIFGQIILFGFTWALMHHALGGVRHFIWDVGKGFGAPARNILGWATVVGSIGLTALIWAIVILVA